MADQILPEGIRFFPKHANAPDFVLGSMVVTMNDLFAFCKANEPLLTEYSGKKQLKLQLLKSKEGKLYAAVDTFKPTPQGAPQQTTRPAITPDAESDLPF